MLMVDSYSTNATVGIVTTTHTRLRSLALTSFTMTLSVLENMFTRLPGLREVRLINLSVPASEGKNYHENNLSRNNYDPSDKQLTHHPVMKILSRYCQGLDAFEFSLHNYPMAKERDYIQIYERVAPNSTDWVLGSENLKHYQNDQQPPVQIPEPQPQRQDEYYEEEQQGQQCPPQESSTALGSSPLSSSLSCRPVPFPAPIPTNPRNLLTTLKFTHPVRSMILNRHWDEVSSVFELSGPVKT
ncbi:hypothetical protein BG004_005269 [Podila humilis]|nr:hypothetical protein BG004_005269 [Podila humilis]